MTEIDELLERQKKLESITSGKEFKSEVYEFINLLNERTYVTRKINRLRWSSLSVQERLVQRRKDFDLTEKYFQKYPEVESKFLFKKAYVEFVDLANNLKEKSAPIISVLFDVLNCSMYVNLKEENPIDYILKQISDDKSMNSLKAAFLELKSHTLSLEDEFFNNFLQ